MSQTKNILGKLIAFDTVSAKSNLALIAYVQSFLVERGFAVTHAPSPCGQKAGLFAQIGPSGAGIMLSAHTDVVPVEGQNWARPPFELTQEDGRLYGRGTTDMKGYLAAMLNIADQASRVQLTEPLKLAISYDEEVGCVGIRQMIDQLVPAIGLPRACFVGEPTEMQVAIGHKGKAALRATCHGQAGHSALAPNFVNALHLGADFISELSKMQQQLASSGARDAAYDVPYSTVHAGMMQGGRALNIVPDTAEITFEYRHLAVDRSDDLMAEITRRAEAVASTYRPRFEGAKIEIDRYNAYPGLATEEDSEVVALAKSLTQTNHVTKVPYGTEAGFFSDLGIPTVVCGPGSMEGQGHKPDEYVTEAQLAACDAMLVRLLNTLTK